jgi:hypothetical protein
MLQTMAVKAFLKLEKIEFLRNLTCPETRLTFTERSAVNIYIIAFFYSSPEKPHLKPGDNPTTFKFTASTPALYV